MSFKNLPLALAGFLLAAQFAVCEDGLLDQVRRRQEVAAQAFEQEIQTALAKAERMKDDPAKATEILQKVIKQLETDSTLASGRRDTLLAAAQARLKAIETAEVLQPRDRTLEAKPRRRDAAADDEAVRRGLTAVRSLRRQGKIQEAQKAVDDLQKQFPDHALVEPLRTSTGTEAQLRNAARDYEEKADRTAAVLRDVQRSAAGIRGDIEYSPNFAALSEKRKAKYVPGGVPLTDKEKSIMRTLRTPTTTPVEFKDLSFDKVMEILKKHLGQPLVVNKAALDELKIGYDVPISASVPAGVAKRTLLRRVLNDLGLTYIIKNETIEVTSVLKARDEMVVRYYQVDDLVGPVAAAAPLPAPPAPPNRLISPQNPFAINNAPNPPTATFRPMQVEALIEMIQSTIAPESWQKNNGPGTIVYYAPTRTLIIKNSAEVINSLSAGSKEK